MVGLDEKTLEAICDICAKYTNIEKVLLFGSRAIGHYKKSSDIDLAIVGELSQMDIWAISGLLNDESPTPYSYDVVDFDSITDEVFKSAINENAKIVYVKGK